VLVTGAISAAPVGLAAGIAGTALASASMAGTTLTLFKLMTMTKLKLGMIGAIAAAGLLAPWMIEHQSTINLRRQNQTLRQQLDQLAGENQRLAHAITRHEGAQSDARDQWNELLRLRGEVGRLREEARASMQARTDSGPAGSSPTEYARTLAGRVRTLKDVLAQRPEFNIPELQFASERDWLEAAAEFAAGTEADLRRALGGLRTLAKNKVGYLMMNALQAYSQANGRQLPPDLEQLKPYFRRPVDDAILGRYQLVATGPVKDLKPGQPAIKENGYVDEQYDTLTKVGPNTFSLNAPKGKVGVPRQLGFSIMADDGAIVGPEAEAKLDEMLEQ
jgi:hypothetical protein